MNLFTLILDGLRQRGGAALWTWVGLMLATWLAFAYGLDREMKGRVLVGAGFVYGAVVLGIFTAVARLQARGQPPPEPKKPPGKKKRRR